MSRIFTLIFLLSIYTGARASTCTSLSEKLSKLNPLVLQLIDLESPSDSKQKLDIFINKLMLVPDVDDELFWVKFLKKEAIYDFYTEGFQPNVDENNEEIERNVNKAFALLIEKVDTEEKCNSLEYSQIKESENLVIEKIKKFYDEVFARKEMGLLYQLIPGGELPETFSPLVYKYNSQFTNEFILKTLQPYFVCSEAKEKEEQKRSVSIFTRIWRWIKSWFSKGEETTEGFNQTQENVSKLLKDVSAEVDQKLSTYSANLMILRDLFESLDKKLMDGYDALINLLVCERKQETEKFEIINKHFWSYFIEFNTKQIDESKTETSYSLEFKSKLTKIGYAIADYLVENSDWSPKEFQSKNKFLISVLSSHVRTTANFDINLCISSIRAFWDRFRSDQMKGIVTDEEKSQWIEYEFTMFSDEDEIQTIGLMKLVIDYLPVETELHDEAIYVEAFLRHTSILQKIDPIMLRVISASRILSGFPFSLNDNSKDYYKNLMALIESFLENNKFDIDIFDKFGSKFDQFIEERKKANDPKVADVYPILKLHNLWASRNDEGFDKITLTEFKVTEEQNDHFNKLTDKRPMFNVKSFFNNLLKGNQEEDNSAINFSDFSTKTFDKNQLDRLYLDPNQKMAGSIEHDKVDLI